LKEHSVVAIELNNTVGELVARQPGLARVFEQAGIDYCCGGRLSLEEACRRKGVDPEAIRSTLERAASDDKEGAYVDAATLSLTELADHIEEVHHGYLRREFPRLDAMTAKVSARHGQNDPRLIEVRNIFAQFANELYAHMMKEEKILFPMIRQLDANLDAAAFHCASIANPIGQMELEHHGAGDALEQLRALTDDYTPPPEACNTYRAMLDALEQLELDMHQHVHKEDNVLFPRAMNQEAELRSSQAPI
jgi:regulator of cell morphogenesis and NO signaling